MSLKKSAELTYKLYQITYTLPESKHTKSRLLKIDDQQAELYQICSKNLFDAAILNIVADLKSIADLIIYATCHIVIDV